MILVKNCESTEARHDYVTGARVCGPNVFYNCTTKNAHADIGPHHRWATGTLYDNIDTDGQINVQDRGNMGSGHGWAGVTQVVWNCRSPKTAVQSPWVSGKNYCIGLIGNKYAGHFSDRPDGEWEGLNQQNLQPESLYESQLKSRLLETGVSQQLPSRSIKVFPNPSRGKVKISYLENELNYNFYSMNGIRLQSGKISESPYPLNLENFGNGLYLLECFTGNKMYLQKLIIQR